ncbi:hypothetical protein BCR37DRAFT_377539 [Protomyces lactucae-debilis]|uniref:Uncharacterized protein n=1 Tax=Protomyces lactucae-debilis TaxID=2754530 RepID=A0A1Y2FLD6_PROLT|nr:uncharacterized protein BCR37DRAFT_377539 [Protomyces lactucae-debilis]ORY84780.1 hypothetical protein BCR37DRAFT_377539 [Protomyces lactucae-debilis]
MDVIPCQQDSPIMRDAELAANNFGSCGRTQAGGNIDTSTAIEQHIDAKMVPEVTKGSTVTLQMHQVNGDGAGPYQCEIDETGTGSTFVKVKVLKDVPGAAGLSATRQTSYDMKIQLPSVLACQGGSTGRVCVMRCRNSAFAGPFGGCFAVSQTDTEGRKDMSPSGVKTKAKIEAIEKQKVEAAAQLGAMKMTNLVGVPKVMMAARQKDGLMQLMPGQTVPEGHTAEKTSPAFIPVNVQNIPDPVDGRMSAQPSPDQLAAMKKQSP